MDVFWPAIVSAGLLVAMKPWSTTLFRAIWWRIARPRPGTWKRPLAVIPAPDVLATAVAVFTGKLRAIDKKAIVIESTDDQVVSFQRSKKRRFLADEKELKPQDIPLGSLVTVNASNFTARIQH